MASGYRQYTIFFALSMGLSAWWPNFNLFLISLPERSVLVFLYCALLGTCSGHVRKNDRFTEQVPKHSRRSPEQVGRCTGQNRSAVDKSGQAFPDLLFYRKQSLVLGQLTCIAGKKGWTNEHGLT